MQTLHQCYTEIAGDSNKWSYYNDFRYAILNTWRSNDDAFQFIENYYEFAGKSEVFNDRNISKNKKYITERASHIISTFLLGIKVAECFQVDTDIRDTENMNFKYYWFVSCLYHDIGYAYEDNIDIERLNAVRKDGIEALKNICDVKYMHKRIFRTYTREMVGFYFRCRSKCGERNGKIDHGIVGGIMLYDKLRKQFTSAWSQRTNKEDSRESFHVNNGGRKMHLSNKHYVAYAKAADAIITHNIWTNTLIDYIKDFGDDDNRISLKSKRISIKNKLCFILSIADTIEPLKRGKEYLDLVKIDSIKDGKGFQLKVDKNTLNKIYNNIKMLEEWVDIKVEIKHDNLDPTYTLINFSL